LWQSNHAVCDPKVFVGSFGRLRALRMTGCFIYLMERDLPCHAVALRAGGERVAISSGCAGRLQA